MTDHITRNPPTQKGYGILEQDEWVSQLDQAADQIRRLGYAVVDSGFCPEEVSLLAKQFDETRKLYIEKWGQDYLKTLDEYNSIRLPLELSPAPFRRLAFNKNVLSLVRQLIRGLFILVQQNGVINPVGEEYNQGLWHRDLPYQHYLSNMPLAINALYCVDDFSIENGGTWVLPATQKAETFPSPNYIERHGLQISARAGQYIVLDCMLYHSGGFNSSSSERRAVNHVFAIPHFSQQIRIPGNVKEEGLSPEERQILGFDFTTPQTIEEFLKARFRK